MIQEKETIKWNYWKIK